MKFSFVIALFVLSLSVVAQQTNDQSKEKIVFDSFEYTVVKGNRNNAQLKDEKRLEFTSFEYTVINTREENSTDDRPVFNSFEPTTIKVKEDEDDK